jgi:hypothetical protein
MSKSAAELRNELKELKKAHPDYKPVSRMAKADISELIGKLKSKLDHTPAPAMSKMKKAPKEEVMEHEIHDHEEKKHRGAVKHVKDVQHAKEAVHVKEMKHAKKAMLSPAEDDKKQAAKDRMAKVRAAKKK